MYILSSEDTTVGQSATSMVSNSTREDHLLSPAREGEGAQGASRNVTRVPPLSKSGLPRTDVCACIHTEQTSTHKT